MNIVDGSHDDVDYNADDLSIRIGDIMTTNTFSVVRDILRNAIEINLDLAYNKIVPQVRYTSTNGTEPLIKINPNMYNWEYDTFADYICSQILERELEANGIEVED